MATNKKPIRRRRRTIAYNGKHLTLRGQGLVVHLAAARKITFTEAKALVIGGR